MRARGEAPRSFSPCLGEAIPRHPFTPDAPEMAKDIPLIVSSTMDERTYRETKFDMTWAELNDFVTAIPAPMATRSSRCIVTMIPRRLPSSLSPAS